MRSESALRVQWSPRLVWLVHRASAVLLVLFAVPHLVNHLFALRGPAAHIAVMEAMRSVYRHPLAEGLLLVAVAVQVLTGAWQLWVARGRTPSRLTRVKRWAGLVVGLFLLQHVSAVLLGRLVLGLETNFYFAAAALVKFPFALYMVPYYFLGVTAFSLHLILALRPQLVKRLGPRWGDWIGWGLVGVSVVVALLILLAFSGLLQPFTLPEAYVLGSYPAARPVLELG